MRHPYFPSFPKLQVSDLPFSPMTLRSRRSQRVIRLRLPRLLASTAIALVILTPAAIAQSIDRVVGALAYPSGSQRFFEDGLERLEQEVDRLQHPAQEPPRLSLAADLMRSREELQQQQEQWFEERLSPKAGDRHSSGSRIE